MKIEENFCHIAKLLQKKKIKERDKNCQSFQPRKFGLSAAWMHIHIEVLLTDIMIDAMIEDLLN